jgi:hypothetical protein
MGLLLTLMLLVALTLLEGDLSSLVAELER